MPAAVTHCESIETADSEDSSAIIQFCAKRCFHVRTERAWQQLQLCTIIAQAIIVLLMNLFSYKEEEVSRGTWCPKGSIGWGDGFQFDELSSIKTVWFNFWKIV